MATLQQLPALVVLERIPVPVLAVAQDGTLLLANTAFTEMVGCSSQELLTFKFHQLFATAPATESVLTAMRALENMVVELAHRDGSRVRALMSRSVLTRYDDPVALATFQDLTEALWTQEP